MKFNQSIGRTPDRPGIPEGPQHAANQRGLAGAEIAIEMDHHAGHEASGKRGAKRFGGGLVGQEN
jgi:hypothetical protein